ncbi:MAG: uroporphyrinogen decarboxylase family protein [Candidatus Eiseniibacteriota bacterium]
MTSRERVLAALGGGQPDRPPVSFWGHVYHRESSARELVDATLERQREFDWDWIKLNPRKHYHVEPWGVAYRYPGVPDEKPALASWPVHAAADWGAVGVRPFDTGALGEQIEAVALVRRALPEVPLLATVFTPLAVLAEMTEVPSELRDHMRSHPDLVRRALEAVTATYERFAPALIAAGADGIYLATTDWASRDLMSPEDYARWARPGDLRILAAVRGAPFNVLHVCKGRNLLVELADYPVCAFSWDATDPSNPTLAEGLARLPGAIMGGISQEGALMDADPGRAIAEFRRGLELTGGHRWLVGPGCSIPPTAPATTLAALAAAIRTTQIPDRRPTGAAAARR